MRYALLVAARLAVAVVCVLTASYAVLHCSPFAFEMFVRPQLFPAITQFSAWHHVWWGTAYLLSVATLGPALRDRDRTAGLRRAARWLAHAYVAVGGAIAAHLLVSPHLPTLWNDARALPTALAALVPMVWLGVIDLLWAAGERPRWAPPAGHQRRVLVTALLVSVYLWLSHAGRWGLTGAAGSAPALALLFTTLWALALSALAMTFAYVCWCLVATVAAGGRTTGWKARGPATILAGVALCEFIRQMVLPTISVDPAAAGAIAGALGLATATSAAGLAARWPGRDAPSTAPRPRALLWTALGLAVLAIATASGLQALMRTDWAFAGQKLLVLVEASAAFAWLYRATRGLRERPWSAAAMLVPPAVALLAVLAIPRAALLAATWTGDRTLEPDAVLERFVASDIAFRFVAQAVVARGGADAGYESFLRQHAGPGVTKVAIPDVALARATPAVNGPRPHIFLFVIDSLRRDYLSPYNPAVGFTPHIESLARDAFVFRNAFTRHGATQLAAPSLWAGTPVVRNVLATGFPRMNALEKLVRLAGYRFAVNDFTVAPYLLPDTPAERLEPEVLSVNTDLCSNLAALQQHLDSSRSDRRPVFGYLSPMNVHILNTNRGGQTSLDGDYPGFYAPYASRVRRMDACLGSFFAYLKHRGLYDDSIIIVTGDHGDSLGEDQYWGHATWLFPEVLRLPLIVRLPPSMAAGVTTDLARVAFISDLAPTLYRLLGHTVRAPASVFGAPLFVPADESPVDRRREAFLVTSSYGAAFGLLRRNGRLLFVTDLVEWREFAYAMSLDSPESAPLAPSPEVRRLNQRLIRERVQALWDFYGARAPETAVQTAASNPARPAPPE